MSSHSYSDTCPNCGKQAEANFDTRHGFALWCQWCGATVQPEVTQCSLEELNERRENWQEAVTDDDCGPLTKLPEWTFEY